MNLIPSIQIEYRKASKPLGTKANLGVVVLQTDETLEHDMRRIIPTDGIALYVSRIANDNDVTAGTLSVMKSDLVGSASLLPRKVSFDAVAYGCTSASCIIGHDAVSDLIRQGCAAPQVVTPLSGLLVACQALGVTRVGLVSPYVPDVNDLLKAAFEGGGIAVVAEACFYQGDDAKVAQLDPAVVADAARQVAYLAECEAIFISCTNVRTLDIILSLESELELPVLSSNQVMIWQLLNAAGVQEKMPGFGMLFDQW